MDQNSPSAWIIIWGRASSFLNDTYSPWTHRHLSAHSSFMKEQKIKNLFGEHIRKFRKSKGLSQEELALQSGLDRTYIGGVERGERNISLINICRIADALSISPDLLLSNLKEPHRK